MQLLVNGATVSRSVTLTQGFGPHLVDLSDLSGITQLILDATSDEEGMIFDNFSFSAGAAVPEPANWALMIAGLGLVGGALRNRRTTIGTHSLDAA